LKETGDTDILGKNLPNDVVGFAAVREELWAPGKLLKRQEFVGSLVCIVHAQLNFSKSLAAQATL